MILNRTSLIVAASTMCLIGCVTDESQSVAGASTGPASSTPAGVKRYTCRRASGPVTIDGRIDEPAWDGAAWTDRFVDIEGDRRPAPRFRTRAKMLWDDTHFYVAAMLEEPHVWGALVVHDSIVYHDNDFEVFIDPDGDRREYYEVEVNALNTIFDLLLERTYIDGGPAVHEWSLKGMQTAIHVDGTLNDPSDTDRGWSVEIAMPWSSLGERYDGAVPPNDGDAWRVNFSRVQWKHRVIDGFYSKQPDTREDNWVWSPQGLINMHVPEMWGVVVFVDR